MNKFIHGTNVSGQSIIDRALAAKHTVAGQSLAKVICKATTEEIMGPKRKHLDYLLQCTNEANISIPQMANLLIERTQTASWVVVFKALVTVHNLMNYGNQRFTQFLASNNCAFSLVNFVDKSTIQGFDMSKSIQRYSKYLNEKAYSYRQMAFDFCKVKRGKEDGLLRKMTTDKLLKVLPVLQTQLDSLIEFDVSANDLTNGVINAAFMLLFKDLIRLFACYNDGIINLLEQYFDMNKKNCKDALDVYKKFLARMERVCEFLKVAESVGIDKGDIPDLAKAPSSLLDALEQHLNSLETNKKVGVVTAIKPTAGVSAAINTYVQASQVGAAPGAGFDATTISEEERQRILEEEQRQLDQMKLQRMKQAGNVGSPASSASSDASKGGGSAGVIHSTQILSNNSPTNAHNNFNAPLSINQSNKSAADDLFGLNSTAAFDSNTNSQSLFSQQHNSLFSQQQQKNPQLQQQQHHNAQMQQRQQRQQQQQAQFNNSILFDSPMPLGSNLGDGGCNAYGSTIGAFNSSNPFGSPATVLNNKGNDFAESGAWNGGSLQATGVLHRSFPSLDSKTDLFASDVNFAAAFGTGGLSSLQSQPTNDASFQLFQSGSNYQSLQLNANNDFLVKNNSFCEILKPMSANNSPANQNNVILKPHTTSNQQISGLWAGKQMTNNTNYVTKLIQSDLDSSLASLAGNLSITPGGQVKKTDHQWMGNTGEKKLTGAGMTWNQSPMMSLNQSWNAQQANFGISAQSMQRNAMNGVVSNNHFPRQIQMMGAGMTNNGMPMVSGAFPMGAGMTNTGMPMVSGAFPMPQRNQMMMMMPGQNQPAIPWGLQQQSNNFQQQQQQQQTMVGNGANQLNNTQVNNDPFGLL